MLYPVCASAYMCQHIVTAKRVYLFSSMFTVILKLFVNCLRYDLIDRRGVLGNYVPLTYHCLYDLSVLVDRIFVSL